MPDRPTFAMALASRIPRVLGKCSDDISFVAEAVNEAQQYLIMDPLAPDEGWFGGHAVVTFNVPVNNLTGLIVTPREIARIVVLDICQRPRPLHNGFYEYLRFGTGAQPRGCSISGQWCGQETAVFDRDSIPTLNPFPTTVPVSIRLYPSNNADLGRRVLIQGLDQNGNPVTSVDATTGQTILGEFVALVAPFSTSAFQYQKLTGLLKDVTLGHVQFFTVDSTGAQTLLSSMEPNETIANYRQYFLNGLPPNCCNTPTGVVQVLTQCRLDFIPVASPSDYLTIPNVPAILEEVQARRYSSMDETNAKQLEAAHHAKALSLLNGQIDLYEGKIQTAVSVKLFNKRRLRPQPV